MSNPSKKRKLLKGNFDVESESVEEDLTKDQVANFEAEALKKIGGSIAFVKGRKLVENG